MFNKNITFILYDGIRNSIFISQVLQPILNMLKEDNNLEITLISFEKTRPSNKILKDLIPANNRLHFVLARKLPFYGKSSLKLALFQLKKLFKIIETDEIIARGPLAGWIAINTIKQTKNKKIKLTIQARGLCAEEYKFTSKYKEENIIYKNIRKLIYKKLKLVELEAYKKDKKLNATKTIESVSPALKEYLATNFHAARSKTIIATKDIPLNVNEQNRIKWRQAIRKELKIKDDQPVYCYSGSYKPWQCIPEIIEYFFNQYNNNKKSFLLLLSPDKKALEKLLIQKNIPNTSYALLNVNPNDLFKYMAAGDIGLLFREKDIINWVSRPTKMLEYQAAGLKIVHNKTIALLDN
jgi:hypothetical protein